MTIHQPTAAVRESFGQAQQQADAMAGPPTPWDLATPASRRTRRRIGFAVVSVLAGGVAGWFGVDWLGGSTRFESTESMSAGARNGTPVPVPKPLDLVSAHNGFAKPGTNLTPTTPTSPPLAVKHPSGLIQITSTNASLADAVRALAQATHTNIHGGDALAAIASPITLQWQGKDTAAAWDALLGRHASIAVSCGSVACELWIVGVSAPRASGDLSANARLAAGDPAQPPRSVAAPSNGDENSETN